VFILSFVTISLSGEPTDTDGDGYINLSTPEDLQWLTEDWRNWTKNFELDNDIDASFSKQMNEGAGWICATYREPFEGIFEGNGYSITNLYINRYTNSYVGFFTVVAASGVVRNLHLENCEISGGEMTGGICAINEGEIFGSTVSGKIHGYRIVGGIAGYSHKSFVRQCICTADISAKGLYVGGLIGFNTGFVIDCISTGNVSNERGKIGGFIGHNYGNVYNSCSIGKVTGPNDYIGGFIGSTSTGVCENCFWDIETSGIDSAAQGTGITTAEMKNPETFRNAKWNLDFIWKVDSDYPKIEINEDYRPQDPDGDGYLNIKTLDDLRWLSESGRDLSSKFELSNDIDLLGENYDYNDFGFLPVGIGAGGFMGEFEGNGHSISNLYINLPRECNQGLFAKCDGAEISNLNLYDVNITGKQNVGGLVGTCSGTIKNCNITGTITAPDGSLGGLAGNFSGDISYCTFTGTINAEGPAVGGLAGNLGYGSAFKCSTEVNIINGDIPSNDTILTNSGTGGFAGVMMNCEIDSCYSDARIKSGMCYSVGGFTGKDAGEISNSSSKAYIYDGYSSVGGFSGNSGSNLDNCFTKAEIRNCGTRCGGFAGFISGKPKRCYAVTKIIDCGKVAGGFAGFFMGDGTYCYCRSYISGCAGEVGGFAGYVKGGGMQYSYSATELVDNAEPVGGFIAASDSNEFVYECLWDTDLARIDYTVSGAAGYSTDEMKQYDTYAENHYWNFETVWAIDDTINDGYPYFPEMQLVAVKEKASLPGCKVYPNITTPGGTISIETEVTGAKNVRLFDLNGKVSDFAENVSGEFRLNENLSAGLYFLIIESGGEILCREKVILE
jgi:hypothetical protein